MQDFFTERLVNVQIHQGIARLDFARLESVNVETNEAKLKPSMRVVMPLDAFMNAVDHMAKVRDDIIAQLAEKSGKPVS